MHLFKINPEYKIEIGLENSTIMLKTCKSIIVLIIKLSEYERFWLILWTSTYRNGISLICQKNEFQELVSAALNEVFFQF